MIHALSLGNTTVLRGRECGEAERANDGGDGQLCIGTMSQEQ